MPVINGIDFYENSGDRKSPVYRWATENSQVQRSLYVRGQPLTHADLTQASLALLGCAYVSTDALGSAGATRRWINRQTPAAFAASETPDNLESAPYLYCTSVPAAEPCSRPAGMDAEGRTEYAWMRYQTVWETLPYDVKEDAAVLAQTGPLYGLIGAPDQPDEGDCLRRGWSLTRYVTKSVDHGAQTVSMRQGFMKYLRGAGEPVAQPIPVGWPMTVARLVITYVWHAVPLAGIPWAGIQAALNGVNKGAFDGYPTATLLFSDAKVRHYRSAFGQRIADVSYTMIYKPNKDPVTGLFMGWEAIIRVKDGKRRYWVFSCDGEQPDVSNLPEGRAAFQFVDFADLFRPDQG
jgi:hypothetical protein